MKSTNVGKLSFMDPTMTWHIKPSLNITRILKGHSPAPDAINYICDDVICIPQYYAGYLSWYDPSTGGPGQRMFNYRELWDHVRRTGTHSSDPYNCRTAWVLGYGGYFLAMPLYGTAAFQANIVRRYLDDVILIYNTGKFGTADRTDSVAVYDPPGDYSVQTNGTRSDNATALGPRQYVLFHKGTAPAIDETTGLFSKSPFGVGKSHPYEMRYGGLSILDTRPVVVPQMYLGIKAPRDMESEIGITGFGGSVTPGGTNTSYAMGHLGITAWFRRVDSLLGTVYEPNMPIGAWAGWGEDENGNVKLIILSQATIATDSYYVETIRTYNSYVYDIDRDERYAVHIVRPMVDIKSDGSGAPPLFSQIGSLDAQAFAYIDVNDAWNKTTTPASVWWTHHGNLYGACDYYSNRIICAEGLGIYTTDPEYTPPPPKAAFGAVRNTTGVGAYFIKILSLAGRQLRAGKIYAVALRHRTFPPDASDEALQNWFKSLQPISLTADDFDAMLRVLPGSFWLYGGAEETVGISAPRLVASDMTFAVNVSCSTRPNASVWVYIVDTAGKIIASNSGTTDANGNATITLTAPSPGEYKIIAITKGNRQMI